MVSSGLRQESGYQSRSVEEFDLFFLPIFRPYITILTFPSLYFSTGATSKLPNLIAKRIIFILHRKKKKKKNITEDSTEELNASIFKT